MKFIAFIPARYGSTRFPAKPLAILGGKPVVQHVYEQVSQAVAEVYVATDHREIVDAVEDFGGKAILTRTNHTNGTNRCMEAYERLQTSTDFILNIQGDEPFIQPAQIQAVMDACRAHPYAIHTLVKAFPATTSWEELCDPHTPKVIIDKEENALYFSRATIPYLRDVPKENWASAHTYYKHIGLYAYPAGVLERIVSLPATPLETGESLEQLRWLEYGIPVRVVKTDIETIGIDTPQDLTRAEQYLQSQTKEINL